MGLWDIAVIIVILAVITFLFARKYGTAAVIGVVTAAVAVAWDTVVAVWRLIATAVGGQ